MKRCPTCDKTFEDSMQFCQVDGTTLVDDGTMGSAPSGADDDVLDLPEADPLKTSYLSDTEMREGMGDFETRQQTGGVTAPVAEWTPPPAPDSNWGNRGIDANTPFQPPMTAMTGQNKTLPIISLVLGILSLCCYVSPLTGLAALITGYLGVKNANNNPSQYGGKGLAIAGMILGGLFLVVGVIFYIILASIGPEALQQWAEEQQRMQRQ